MSDIVRRIYYATNPKYIQDRIDDVFYLSDIEDTHVLFPFRIMLYSDEVIKRLSSKKYIEILFGRRDKTQYDEYTYRTIEYGDIIETSKGFFIYGSFGLKQIVDNIYHIGFDEESCNSFDIYFEYVHETINIIVYNNEERYIVRVNDFINGDFDHDVISTQSFIDNITNSLKVLDIY